MYHTFQDRKSQPTDFPENVEQITKKAKNAGRCHKSARFLLKFYRCLFQTFFKLNTGMISHMTLFSINPHIFSESRCVAC